MRTTALAVLTVLVTLGAAARAAAQPAGTLLVGLVAEPVNLDPAQVTDLNSNRVGRRVVETLVTFPDESTQIVPGKREFHCSFEEAQLVPCIVPLAVELEGVNRTAAQKMFERIGELDFAS